MLGALKNMALKNQSLNDTGMHEAFEASQVSSKAAWGC